MKRWYNNVLPLAMAVLVTLPALCNAQIKIDARLTHDRVLQYEPVLVTVRVRNNTSREITLEPGKEGSRLAFAIEQTPGQVLRALPEADLPTLVIPPHEQISKEVDLLDAFDLRRTGPYTIRTRVYWGGNMFTTAKSYLDIVPGFEIERMVADPGKGYAFRTFSLRTLNRERGEHVFLKIEEEDRGLCFGVIGLGRIVRMRKPALHVDRDGHVHVFHQSAPTQYTHTVLDPNGSLIDRNLYFRGGNGPALQIGDDGQATVVGGRTMPAQPSSESLSAFDDMDLMRPVGSSRTAD